MCTKVLEKNISLETLISIFTIDKGEIKVLLERVNDEPYKGYWMIPNTPLYKDMTIEENLLSYVNEELGLCNISLDQNKIFSDELVNDIRKISISYNGLIDSKTIELKKSEINNKELHWFLINEIPKMAYDHERIINCSIKTLKKKIKNTEMLKLLFPSDFTLPELQKIFELILGQELDRRNFRKKLISLDLIEDTNEFNIGCNGRPAKLYRFKDDIKEIDIF